MMPRKAGVSRVSKAGMSKEKGKRPYVATRRMVTRQFSALAASDVDKDSNHSGEGKDEEDEDEDEDADGTRANLQVFSMLKSLDDLHKKRNRERAQATGTYQQKADKVLKLVVSQLQSAAQEQNQSCVSYLQNAREATKQSIKNWEDIQALYARKKNIHDGFLDKLREGVLRQKEMRIKAWTQHVATFQNM